MSAPAAAREPADRVSASGPNRVRFEDNLTTTITAAAPKPGKMVPRAAHLGDAYATFASASASGLPAAWSQQHDHVLCSLDAAAWADPVGMIVYLKAEFPELEGQSLAKLAVAARLKVLDATEGVAYWKHPLPVPSPREFRAMMRERALEWNRKVRDGEVGDAEARKERLKRPSFVRAVEGKQVDEENWEL